MASIPSSSLSKPIISSKTCLVGSSRLAALAQQLRLYKHPPTFDDEEEERLEGSADKVVSQVGFVESATQVKSERFKPKRAAVLICLFEGEGGDLRVILTKRSSGLSTHSGLWHFPEYNWRIGCDVCIHVDDCLFYWISCEIIEVGCDHIYKVWFFGYMMIIQ